MYCPRLNHFVRLNQDGTIGKCGHMRNAIGFKTFNDLDNSKWLQGIKDTMSKDEWPDECHRCQQTEEVNGTSIRTKSIDRHKLLHPVKENYLVVGGVLDNICNSACQTCNSKLSTKIGSLESKDYTRINNFENFWKLPQKKLVWSRLRPILKVVHFIEFIKKTKVILKGYCFNTLFLFF